MVFERQATSSNKMLMTASSVPSLLLNIFVLLAILTFLGGVHSEDTSTSRKEEECLVSDSGSVSCSSTTTTLTKYHQFYINGIWVDPSSSSDPFKTLPVINPSTGQAFASIALATKDEVNAATNSAKQAYESTSWSSHEQVNERIKCLKRFIKIYKRRQEEMAQIISQEMGSPISLSRYAQTPSGYGAIETYLDALEEEEFMFGRLLKDPNGRPRTTLLYEPVGVAALITPWNWPMNQVALKVGAALLVGCTVVLKPSELAPLSSVLFTEIIHEAGFPPGVFNMIHGTGPYPGVGNLLARHPDVDMVSFTGSAKAGIDISKTAATTLKRVSLELGGKGANIIFADVGMKKLKGIVEGGVSHLLTNSGQSCNAPSRMLVERSIYEIAIQYAKGEAEACRVDYAHVDGDEHIGPVVSQMQYDKIQNYIRIGIDDPQVILITGGLGKAVDGAQGYFVKPTIFADVDSKSILAQKEIFGPVLVMIPFDTEEEAIEIANDTPYGLTNYVQTSNPKRLKRLAKQLRSGMVQMNSKGGHYLSPFGGIKMSGHGRENGHLGLEEFCTIKAVSGWPYYFNDDEEDEGDEDYDYE